MAQGSTTWQSLAEQTANRLRLLQADLADEPADVRREHLMDEVREAASKVLPTERSQFLSAIEDRFPSWDASTPMASVGPSGGETAASVSPTDLAEYNDPSWLVRRLAELSGSMSAEQKRTAGERLAAAGLSIAASGDVPHEEAKRVCDALKLPEETQLDVARLMELVATLIEQVVSLDQISSQTWRQMAPQSRTRRRADLARMLASYASGDDEIGRAQMSEEVERLRQLVAAMLASISQAGQVAFQQMQTYAPARIEGIAKAENRGWGGIEKACWAKYVELAGSMDQNVVESAIINSIASYAERLMTPGRR